MVADLLGHQVVVGRGGQGGRIIAVGCAATATPTVIIATGPDYSKAIMMLLLGLGRRRWNKPRIIFGAFGFFEYFMHGWNM